MVTLTKVVESTHCLICFRNYAVFRFQDMLSYAKYEANYLSAFDHYRGWHFNG